MSLINNVLRELDRRHASESDRGGLPNEVRPLPEAPVRKRAVWRVAGLLVVVAGGWLGWLTLQRGATLDSAASSPVPAVAETPSVAPVAAPVPSVAEANDTLTIAVLPAPTSGVSAAPGSAPESAPTVSSSDASSLADEQLRLKISTELSLSFSRTAGAATPEAKVAAPAAKAASPAVPAPIARVPPAPLPTAPAVLPKPASPPSSAPKSSDVTVGPAIGPAIGPASKPLSAPANPASNSAATAADDWAKAQMLVRAGSNDEAEPLLRRVVESQPTAVAPRQALVGLLLGSRRFAEAIPVLKVGVQRVPQQTGWAMNLARLHVDAGDYASAWEALAIGLPHAQQQADYLAFAGTVLQRIDRSVDAATQYQAALRLRPEEARWWVGLGIALDAAGHPVEAKTAFRRAKAMGGYSSEMARYIDQKLQ